MSAFSFISKESLAASEENGEATAQSSAVKKEDDMSTGTKKAQKDIEKNASIKVKKEKKERKKKTSGFRPGQGLSQSEVVDSGAGNSGVVAGEGGSNQKSEATAVTPAQVKTSCTATSRHLIQCCLLFGFELIDL